MAVSEKAVEMYVLLIKKNRKNLSDIPFEDVRTAVEERLTAE